MAIVVAGWLWIIWPAQLRQSNADGHLQGSNSTGVTAHIERCLADWQQAGDRRLMGAWPRRDCNEPARAAAAVAAAAPLAFDEPHEPDLRGLHQVASATDKDTEPAMPPRTASQILAEWQELAVQREEASDTDTADGIAARTEQGRREYIEGTPPDQQPAALRNSDDAEPRIQMKLPL